MAFLIYKKDNGKLVATEEAYSLAGYNLIFQLWEDRGKPTDQGWHVSADDLIRARTGGQESWDSRSLLIDFNPNSKWRIGLVELLDIYIYTYRVKQGEASWSPMMLRLRDVLYEESDKEISKEEKRNKIAVIDDPQKDEDFVEFLYLNGTDKGWNWGVNGKTNAAFIHGSAREYFRQYF